MTPETVASKLLDLYYNNKDMALTEVFCMAKAYAGKNGDMPNEFWAKVAKIIMNGGIT